MYLGVQGLMPTDLNEVDEKTTTNIRKHGFSGVACRYFDPINVTKNEVTRLRSVLSDGGIVPCQVVAQHPDLINPSSSERRKGIEAMQKMCEVTSWLKAGNLYVRPGSLNPDGSWFAHPDNHRDETFETLVASLTEVCKAAEQENVMLAVEGHTLSTLDTAERILDLIDTVGSEKLRFNMDPVNFISSLKDAYSTTSLQEHIYEVLGPYIICGHAKDFFIQNRLVLHLEETVIGEGILDQRIFLEGFETHCPEGYVQIEHLPEHQIPIARKNLYEIGIEAGVNWIGLDS
ncbi:MAG: hypothetical protein CL749_08545 [Chloroflexi bacterium]|nr:hypothetical protein [Chloroflexota bacterium]